MKKITFAEQHIMECMKAMIAESRGDEEKSARLRAQARLRLVCMSEGELRELAERTCCPPVRSAEEAYWDITQTIVEYKATTDKWVGQAFGGVTTSQTG